MKRNYYVYLVLILAFTAVVGWVIWPNNPGISMGDYKRSFETRLGLDLKGGMQVLLEADVPAGQLVSAQEMQDTQKILENRSNGLGVSEVLFQTAGSRRIVGEFPGVTDTTQVINALKQTGLLEFVDMGSNPVQEGNTVVTDSGSASSPAPSTTLTPGTTAASPTPATTITPTPLPPGETAPLAASTPTQTVLHTVMTGADLKSVGVQADSVGGYVVSFVLTDKGSQIFKDFTSTHVGQYLGIVLDKKVISSPVIKVAITEGQGIIEGKFTRDSANTLAIQLRYGSLPLPIRVAEVQVVGPTLGQDSVRQSMIGGIIGLAAVMLFMILFYRLPGVLADLALIVYAMSSFALFKLIPVTLTLAGIAGFVLSIGMAVDANILIFERLKEELRAGRTLFQAIDLGWKRAWPSIRDANISTLITCVILFWFGSAYGATIVKGFSVTLFLGVVVSMFTAILVTRTFLHVTLDNLKFAEHPKWFGL